MWRVEFFKIGKRDVTFIRKMRVAKVLLSNLYTVPETDNFENNKLTSYSLHLTHACTVYVLCMMLIWLNLENNCVTFGIFFVHAC